MKSFLIYGLDWRITLQWMLSIHSNVEFHIHLNPRRGCGSQKQKPVWMINPRTDVFEVNPDTAFVGTLLQMTVLSESFALAD